MIKAGTLMGYSDQQLLSSIRTGYKDPYHTSVITKAKRKDINIDVPSYGKGYYKNAYQNIIRNASQVIAVAWGRAEQEYGQDNKAIGFYVKRGSSYRARFVKAKLMPVFILSEIHIHHFTFRVVVTLYLCSRIIKRNNMINSELNFTLEEILPKFPKGFQEKIKHSVELLRKAEKLALAYSPDEGFYHRSVQARIVSVFITLPRLQA